MLDMDDVVKEIELCKSRMKEIVEARPVKIESFKEYEAIECRLNVLEVGLKQRTGGEYATRLEDISARWDLRTNDVQIIFGISDTHRGCVLFKHAESIRHELVLKYCIQFNHILAHRISCIDYTDSEGYVKGVVGIVNLGIHEIKNSNWMKEKSIEPQSGIRHFCLVFAHVVIDVLAEEVEGRSCSKDMEIDFISIINGDE